MQSTTSRQFRRQHLHHYGPEDFETFSDYFLYLHLNSRVQVIHAVGFWLALPFIPWSVKKLFQKNPWPFIAVSVLFYGSGFASHWTEDGLVSKTASSFFRTYWEAIVLNWRCTTGSQRRYEAEFVQKYPHVLWVFFGALLPPLEAIEGNPQRAPAWAAFSPSG